MKELAKQYLAALKRQFPGRAPIVVGHCIAGPVAHEMALQLSGESQGSFPDLILIESASRRGWFRHLRELDGDMAPSPSHPEFIRHYLSILDSFVPGIYPWRISLLLSETSRKHRDATLGWNMCAIEAIDLIPIPGDHHEAIRDYREELGTILHGVIDQIPR